MHVIASCPRKEYAVNRADENSNAIQWPSSHPKTSYMLWEDVHDQSYLLLRKEIHKPHLLNRFL
jgi:hypothetical protein